MATLVSTVLTKVGVLLQDPSYIRWTLSELLGWVNDAQREVVLYKPEACVITAVVPFVAGTTRQQLTGAVRPVGSSVTYNAARLVEVIRNHGYATGVTNTPGRSISFVDRAVMDAQNPEWHTDPAGVRGVRHYMHDPRDPMTFFIWPKQTYNPNLEICFSYLPESVTSANQSLSVSDQFANAVVDYILFRCYSKNAEYAGDANLAIAHYQAFANAMGIKGKVDAETAPVANEH
jgi:hypothetical protein